MTDARLVPSFLTHPVIEGLTDPAYRVYVNGVVYSTDKGFDGFLPLRALRLLHPEGADPRWVQELVDSDLWRPGPEGYTIRNFLRYQTPAEQVERHRELARLRKQAERQRKAEAEESKLRDTLGKRVTRDGSRDGSRDERATVPRTGQGQDRDRTGVLEGDEQTNWPAVTPPGAGLPVTAARDDDLQDTYADYFGEAS